MKLTAHVTDTNGKSKGLQAFTVECDAGGDPIEVEYAGKTYLYRRQGTNIATGKAVTEFGADQGASRIWLANDFSFLLEDF